MCFSQGFGASTISGRQCTCLGAQDDEKTGQPNFEKLVVLAVLYYCSNAFSLRRTDVLMVHESRTKLMNRIRSRRKESSEEEDCLRLCRMVLVDSCQAANGTLLPMGIKLLRHVKSRREDKGWTGVNRALGRYFRNEHFDAPCEGYCSMGSVVPNE